MKLDLSLCGLPFIDRQRFKWRVNTDQRLGASAKLVLDCLIMHVNCKFEECFPGQALICEETALAEGSVRTALKALKDCGWIEWRKGPHGGHVYRILWEANPEIVMKRDSRRIAQTPSDLEGVDEGATPSNLDAAHPQNLRAKVQTGFTKEDTSLSSASPTKESEPSIEKRRSPSAEPLQHETVEWWQDRIWNLTGPRFKAKFYPTISMSAFKKRLGETLRRQAWDIPTVDRAICQAIDAEPGCDAWQYVSGILRRKAEAGPDYAKPLTVRGVM